MIDPRIALTLLLLIAPPVAAAQSPLRCAGVDFHAARAVTLVADARDDAIVVEFLHHGQINERGSNVVVAHRDGDSGEFQPVPTRVMQLGPGDFCRLAFQTVGGERQYAILYGGEAINQPLPEWTFDEGLLMETRAYVDCDLNRLESVQRAFESAPVIGRAYVDAVRHAGNPMLLGDRPHFTLYSGTLFIDRAGTYGFYTSSQDASFLLIDGEPIVAAPGRHGPQTRVRPALRRDMKLARGPHRFEYLHAAAGARSVTLAAWVADTDDPRARPVPIPAAVFGGTRVSRLAAGPIVTPDGRSVPDFELIVAGDVPLPNNAVPLIAVRLRNESPAALLDSGRCEWQFGDGQQSNAVNPQHVYLRPGVYPVTLSIECDGQRHAITHRVQVDRPNTAERDPERLHRLDQYLHILGTYDPRKLDLLSLRQLVLAYAAKVHHLETRGWDVEAVAAEQADDPNRRVTRPAPEAVAAQAKQAEEQAQRYLEATVAKGLAGIEHPLSGRERARVRAPDTAGQASSGTPSLPSNGDSVFDLAEVIGSIARDRLARPEVALRAYHAAADRATGAADRAACLVAAADVSVNDLLLDDRGAKYLEIADRLIDQSGTDVPEAVKSRRDRVRGDLLASRGEADAAREAYRAAERRVATADDYTKRVARGGAYARSTEAFLREGEPQRAIEQLRRWQADFPAAALESQLPLLMAQYWLAVDKKPVAVACCRRLLTLRPNSAYAESTRRMLDGLTTKER